MKTKRLSLPVPSDLKDMLDAVIPKGLYLKLVNGLILKFLRDYEKRGNEALIEVLDDITQFERKNGVISFKDWDGKEESEDEDR